MIGYYNPSVTPLMLCVFILYISGGDLQFKDGSERHIFWETFHGNFIYSQSFCQKSAEIKSPKKYFFIFCFLILILSRRHLRREQLASYIQNWPLHTSVRITAQLLTSLMLCALIIYMSGKIYSLTSTPNDRLLRNVYLLPEFLTEICWEEIAEEKIFFCI